VGFVFFGGVFFLSLRLREQKVTSAAAVVVGQDCNGSWIWKKKKVVLVFTVRLSSSSTEDFVRHS
jgi:hypothetical protein